MDIKDTFIAATSALTDLVQRVRPEHMALEAPPYARFHDGQTMDGRRAIKSLIRIAA